MTPLIAGGGPAGAAAAILLARGGASPRLLERSTEPHDVVCGAFLGWDALASLRVLGIDPAALGAHPITRVRVIAGGRIVETALPHPAAGLSRRILDEALLAAAATARTRIDRGITIRDATGTTLRLRDGDTATGDALFLATGKHDLRGLARPRPLAPSIGFRTALPVSPKLTATLTGMIELHAFDGGYAGILLQEDGRANFCLSASADRIGPGGVDALLAEIARDAPLLADRAATARDWVAIAGVPYGWRTGKTEPNLFRLGDQAAVIASLAGDGVAIALASGASAARAYLRTGPAGAQAWQRDFAARSRRPLLVASTIRHMAEHSRWRGPMTGLLAALPGIARIAARATRIGH
ncbi:FAD-dependent monooxygenase [Sphingomonas montana]|uniref:FAD-dependent monooxygenase n=1 Tax=Sphingomonas montana TaxID=1843236 RepID=UPI00101AD951|nr:FAD-dependent monooxygenase [Sphingomonas montana]